LADFRPETVLSICVFKLPTYLFSNQLCFPASKTLERHSLNLKKCLFNVLIAGESNFDKKKCLTAQSFNRKEVHNFFKNLHFRILGDDNTVKETTIAELKLVKDPNVLDPFVNSSFFS
jgi:hypothetical protein